MILRRLQQTRKKKSQLLRLESHLFCAVCYLLENWEPPPNQLGAKHRDLYRFGHVAFWWAILADEGPQSEPGSAWNSKTAFFPLQVNGKTYNQARLLLGTIGSLHPANRLAAYITGRVNLPAEITKKAFLKLDPANKANAPALPYVKAAAGTAAPSTITTTTALEPKTPTQAAGKCVRDTSAVSEGFVLSRSNPLKITCSLQFQQIIETVKWNEAP